MPWFGGNEKAYRDRRQPDVVLWPGAQMLLTPVLGLPLGQVLIVEAQARPNRASVRLSGGIAVIPATEAEALLPFSTTLIVLPEARREPPPSWLQQGAFPQTPPPPWQALIIQPGVRREPAPSWLQQGVIAQTLSPYTGVLIVDPQPRRKPASVRLSGGIVVIPAPGEALPPLGQALIVMQPREWRARYTVLCGGIAVIPATSPQILDIGGSLGLAGGVTRNPSIVLTGVL